MSLIGGARPRDLGLGAESATAARLKILASLWLGSGELAERIAARFGLAACALVFAPDAPPALRQLAEAVGTDSQVRQTYESWKKITKPTIRRSVS